MKNITITLDERVARWARVEAAKEGKSLSRWIGERLEGMQIQGASQREALDRFLAAPDLPGITSDLPSREELYAERLFHRHERAPIRKGPRHTKETRKGNRVAKRSG